MSGYIKISRDILDNPWVNKDPDHLAVMIYLLKEAAYAEHTVLLGDKEITLKPGQLVTGREKLSRCTGVQADKAGRILKRFETAHLIAQQMHSKGRLISLIFSDSDSEVAQQDAQQMHSSCTANAQQLHTTEERNKGKEIKEKGVSKDTPKKKTQTSMVEESDLPAETKAKLIEWLKYKTERKQGYKETGLNALIRQVGRYVASLGVDTVNNRIEEAMSNGWIGMNLDKVQGARSSPPRAAPKAEEYSQEDYDRIMAAIGDKYDGW